MIDYVKRNGIFLMILIFICFAILIPINPNQMPYTHRDSGVFLYTGWRITQGEVPYRDVWDHKPPIIFFINALGLSLSGGTRWGVWYIECLSLLITTFAGYYLLRKLFNKHVSLLSMFLFLTSLHFLFKGGNLTNEYILPLQMISLIIMLDSNKSDVNKPKWIVLGVFAAIGFFTKQTTIGIWIAILIYQTIMRLNDRMFKKWLGEMALFGLGGGFISAIIIVYFAVNNALNEFYSSNLKFNYVYSSLGKAFNGRLESLLSSFSSLEYTGLLTLSLFGVAITILLLLSKIELIKKYSHIFMIGLISLPIEFYFISLSSRGFYHYFISVLPVLTIFTGVLLWLVYLQLENWKIPEKYKTIQTICLVIVLMIAFYQPYKMYNDSNHDLDDSQKFKYITELTTPDQKVTIWGNEVDVSFLVKRSSSSRFIYMTPLYTQNYTNEAFILEFLDGIVEKKPQLLIDAQNETQPFLEFPIESDAISNRIDWIKDNYRQLEPLENWMVYVYDSE